MPKKTKTVKRQRIRAVWPCPEVGDFIRLANEQYVVSCASDGVPYVVHRNVEYQLRLNDKSWTYDKDAMARKARENRYEALRLEKKLQWLGGRVRERWNTSDKIMHYSERPL